MKKKITWLFLAAVVLLAVPASHASNAKQGLNFDGTEPPVEPAPWPHVA